MGRVLIVGLLGVMSMGSGGCVVWDIKNNLESINDRLGRVDGQLTQIDGQLEGINGRLDTLQSDLEPLPELTRLEQLEKINASIDPIEKHLASLRRTIANIDSTIPFLQISDDTGDETELQPMSDEAGEPEAVPALQEPPGD